jgi:hypothetical protein
MSEAASILGRMRDLQEKLVKAKGDIRVAAKRDMMIAQGHSLNMIVQQYNSMIRSEQTRARFSRS